MKAFYCRKVMGRAATVAALFLAGVTPLRAGDVFTPQEVFAPGASHDMPVWIEGEGCMAAPLPPPQSAAAHRYGASMHRGGPFEDPMFYQDPAVYADASKFLPPPPPTPLGLRVEVDIAPSLRDSKGEVVFATLGPEGDPVFGTDSLDYPFQCGSRSLIGLQIDPRHSVEFIWTAFDNWNVAAALRNDDPVVGGVGNLFTILSDFGDLDVVGLDFVQVASLNLSTSLDTAELNLRQKVQMPPGPATVDILYGARYVQLDERLNFATLSALPAPLGAANNVNVATANKMFGFQLGGVMHYHCMPGLWVDVEAKGAMLQNIARQNTLFTQTLGGAAAEFPSGLAVNRTTWLGDLAAMVNIQLTPNIWIRLGYEAIWLNGVALAEQNVPNATILQLGPTELDHRGEIVFHGPRIGIGGSW